MEETLWYEITQPPFQVYGVQPEEGCLTRRLPESVAATVSEGVHRLSSYGTGGRVRFATDSAFVALKAEYLPGELHTVNNHCLTYGFDLYCAAAGQTDAFVDAFCPLNGFDGISAQWQIKTRNQGKLTDYTLNLPVFSGLKRLEIGLEAGCRLESGQPYRNELPVIFYGSSITHGASAGRPGNTYENFISQRYNLHYRNLGFAGLAKAEDAMAVYLSQQEMCAFVCDYDHNASDAEHLQKTHYKLYETIRRKHPDIPYIMISKPDFFHDPGINARRRTVIFESYVRARKTGDRKVWFVDGETLFEGEHALSCTSDGCHPNDLGFYRMSCKIGAVLAEALKLADALSIKRVQSSIAMAGPV